MIERLYPHRNVVEARRIECQRGTADSHVVVAGGVGIQRSLPNGGIVSAAGVGDESRMPDGGVGGAGIGRSGGGAHQRISADGGVVGDRAARRAVGVLHGLVANGGAFDLGDVGVQRAIAERSVVSARGGGDEGKLADGGVVLAARRNDGVTGIGVAQEKVVAGGAVGDGIGQRVDAAAAAAGEAAPGGAVAILHGAGVVADAAGIGRAAGLAAVADLDGAVHFEFGVGSGRPDADIAGIRNGKFAGATDLRIDQALCARADGGFGSVDKQVGAGGRTGLVINGRNGEAYSEAGGIGEVAGRHVDHSAGGDEVLSLNGQTRLPLPGDSGDLERGVYVFVSVYCHIAPLVDAKETHPSRLNIHHIARETARDVYAEHGAGSVSRAPVAADQGDCR